MRPLRTNMHQQRHRKNRAEGRISLPNPHEFGAPSEHRDSANAENNADESTARDTVARAQRRIKRYNFRGGPPADSTFTRESFIWPDEELLLPSRRASKIYSNPSSSKSNMLPGLGELERNFVLLVESGNVVAAAQYLADFTQTNVNAKDAHGYTMLYRAVKNQDLPMIKLLLSHTTNKAIVSDEVMHAVKFGNCEIVEMLLDVVGEQYDKTQEFYGWPDSNEFGADVTPLMLAAHDDDFHMMKLLLLRGHALRKPEPPGSARHRKLDKIKLEYATSRLDMYRAVASPMYIALTEPDVIHAAFQLARELGACAAEDAQFGAEYTKLADCLGQFAANLINKCQTSAEIEVLLKQSYSDAPKNALYPRVYMALQCEQKAFVASANCQHVLKVAWFGSWLFWISDAPLHIRIFNIATRILLFPVLCIVYLLSPVEISAVRQFAAPPVYKFVTNVASYFAFLVLIFREAAFKKDPKLRSAPNSGLEPLVICWCFGLCIAIYKRFMRQGLSTFLLVWWNVYDLLMLTCFVGTFAMWYVSTLRAARMPPGIERKFWPSTEPALIAEAMFAIATVLAFGKLLEIFQVAKELGPFLISLGRMGKDIARFLAIFALVIFSFAVGLHSMYAYYDGQTRYNSDGSKTSQVGSFVSFRSTLKTLFWAMFGLSSVESADVVIDNTFPNGTVWPNYTYHAHHVTEFTGYSMFGAFEIVAVLVLLNTLVAVMSNSFQSVVDNSDAVWKFARAELWVTYIDQGTFLPPPFNVLPSMKLIVRTLTFGAVGKASKSKRSEKEKMNDPKWLLARDVEYQDLLNKLIKRWLHDRENATDDTALSKKDIDELQLQMREIRQELAAAQTLINIVHRKVRRLM